MHFIIISFLSSSLHTFSLFENKLIVVVLLHIAKKVFEWFDSRMISLVVLVVSINSDDKVADGEGEHSLVITLVAKGRIAWGEEFMIELNVNFMPLNVTFECTYNIVECI